MAWARTGRNTTGLGLDVVIVAFRSMITSLFDKVRCELEQKGITRIIVRPNQSEFNLLMSRVTSRRKAAGIVLDSF